VFISSVLDMQCLFVSNRQDDCLSGHAESIKKERSKYKPSKM